MNEKDLQLAVLKAQAYDHIGQIAFHSNESQKHQQAINAINQKIADLIGVPTTPSEEVKEEVAETIEA